MAGLHVCHLTVADGKRRRGEPSSGPPRFENYSRATLFPAGFSSIGQGGIDAVGERADVVAQRTIGAVDHDGDGREDERVCIVLSFVYTLIHVTTSS